MIVFVDTSAFIALVSPKDRYHSDAKRLWVPLLRSDNSLEMSNYVFTETVSIIQQREGVGGVRIFVEEVSPPVRMEWVTEMDHQVGVASVLGANRRSLSLVDCVSFEVMRRRGIRKCFTFDPHFADLGFEALKA